MRRSEGKLTVGVQGDLSRAGVPYITVVWYSEGLALDCQPTVCLTEFGAVDLWRHLKGDFHRFRHHKVGSVVLYHTSRIPSDHPAHFEPIPGHTTLWYAQSAPWAQWVCLTEHAP